jgi:hypothetical protein
MVACRKLKEATLADRLGLESARLFDTLLALVVWRCDGGSRTVPATMKAADPLLEQRL